MERYPHFPSISQAALLCTLLWCAVVLFALAPLAHAGFGITPPFVLNDKLGRGSVFTQDIILVRGDPVEDLLAELTVSAPGFESWVTIDRGNKFLLPKGAQQVPIKVTVQVPQDADYNRYQGYIRIKTTSPDPASGVSIALGAQIDIDIRVQDKIRDFEVKRALLAETEAPRRVGWVTFPGKIAFTMELENTGNAPVAPSKVVFEILDKRNTTVLETTRNTNTIAEVPPFGTQNTVAYLPTRLPPGAYLVRYSIFHFEEQIKRSGELTLSVLPHGTLSAYVGYGFEGLSRVDQVSVVAPLVVVLLALIAGLLVLRNRRRRRSGGGRPPEYGESPQQAGPGGYRENRAPEPPRRSTAPAPPRRYVPEPPRRTGAPVSSHPGRTPHGVVDLSGRRRQP